MRVLPSSVIGRVGAYTHIADGRVLLIRNSPMVPKTNLQAKPLTKHGEGFTRFEYLAFTKLYASRGRYLVGCG